MPGAVDWQSAVDAVQDEQWQVLDKSIPMDQPVTWVYLDLTKSTFRILYLGNPYLTDYKLISPVSGKEFYQGGLFANKDSRVIFHPEYLLPLSSSWGDELLLRIEARPGYAIPLDFLTTNQVSRLTAMRFLGDGMYYGAATLMIIFAVCVAVINRDSHAARLSATLLSWLFAMVTVSGYGNLLLWPNNPQLFLNLMPLSLSIAAISSSWFSWHFLKDVAKGSLFLKAIEVLFWFSWIVLAVVIFTNYADEFVRVHLIAVSIFVISAATVGALGGDRGSQYLILAASFVAVPVCLVPTVPEFQNYLSVTATASLLCIIIAVMSRLGLKIQRQEIEAQVVKSRAQFLATMSHEIRTPLNGVIGFSELCANESMAQPVADYVAQINRSSTLLLNVVNEVLDFSKLESGAISVEFEAMPVKEKLKNIVSALSPIANSNNVTVSVNVAEDVAPMVVTDPNRCGQILMNLLSNAIKFAKGGDVTVAVFQEFGRLKFKVSDNGIGISKDAIDSVFDPYRQATDHTSRMFGGTGLGLSIAKQFAELIGGTITVRSELGKGSAFTLQIPYEEAVIEAIKSNRERGFNLQGLNVLVAEDNTVNQLLACTILSNEGVLVDQAINGRVAIEKASAKRYDLIFMDIQMPEINGIEAAAALRKVGCKTPIIALTASNSEPDKQACKEVGMSDFLAKPFAKSELLGKLGQWGCSQVVDSIH